MIMSFESKIVVYKMTLVCRVENAVVKAKFMDVIQRTHGVLGVIDKLTTEY